MTPLERAGQALASGLTVQGLPTVVVDGRLVFQGMNHIEAYEAAPLALAVLQAYREPSEGMVEAGGYQIPNNEDDWEPAEPREIWRAMIDAALSES